MTLSIRNRLLFTLLGTILTAWSYIAYSSYKEVKEEVGELFDAQLVQEAHTLLTLVRHELQEEMYRRDEIPITPAAVPFGIFEIAEQAHKYEHKLIFQIWLSDSGQLLIRSQGAPEQALSTSQEKGFSNNRIDGARWRIYTLYDEEHKLTIQLGEHYDFRDHISNDIAWRQVTPLLFFLPLLAILIAYGIAQGLRPLNRLANEVSSREAEHLAPLNESSMPRELQPVVHSLNMLLKKLSVSLENERRFTADASHELRTPLAVLKTQAQLAQRAQTEEQRRQALEALSTGVDRAHRLVEQLLTLARLDPQQYDKHASSHPLDSIASEVLAELAPRAIEHGIELNLNAVPAQVHARAEYLYILLRNLVDNAIRYSPRGACVDVTIQREDSRIILQVDDSGPGIPEEEREKVMERFYRLRSDGPSGSGLGLSIVGRIVELLNGSLNLQQSPAAGLRVQIILPSSSR